MREKEKRSVSGFLAKKLKTKSNSDYDYLEESNNRIKSPHNPEKNIAVKLDESEFQIVPKEKAHRPISGASKDIPPKSEIPRSVHSFEYQDKNNQEKEIPANIIKSNIDIFDDTPGMLPSSSFVSDKQIDVDEISSQLVDEPKTFASEKSLNTEIPIAFLLSLKKGFLSLRELQVIMAILEKASFKFNTPTSISYAALSMESGIHQPHIPKAIGSLIDKGLVIKEKNCINGQNQYTAIIPKLC